MASTIDDYKARAVQLQDALNKTKRMLAEVQKRANALEAWKAKAQVQLLELRALVKDVKDHVDPTKEDIVLAAREAKKWVMRAVKLLRRIF